jgi:formate hydrogenlyase subunit 3/multisubunit Na+/H+ antiporter MnhD subunit
VDWKEEIRNRNEVRRRLNRLAWLLDSSIPIPGTRFSIGIDALIGLVPFIGDIAGVLLSSTILIEAARLGAGRSVLARMALNVALEGLAGVVPFAGDVFDAAWKANQRNVRLLNQWLDQPQRAERSSVLLVAGLVASLVALVVILLLLAFLALRWLMDCC